ncbi:MAG: hypothetical protein ACI9DO_002130 [Reinekea sp.]|jgi:hypothetical protein
MIFRLISNKSFGSMPQTDRKNFLKKNMPKMGFGFMFPNVLISLFLSIQGTKVLQNTPVFSEYRAIVFYILFTLFLYFGYLLIINLVSTSRIRNIIDEK